MDDKITPDNTLSTEPTTPITPSEDTKDAVSPHSQILAADVTGDSVDPQDEKGFDDFDDAEEEVPESVYRDESGVKQNHPMKAYLASQPKVAFMIPIKDGENPDIMEYVSINGYGVWIKKGVLIDIPKPIFDILKESYNVTSMIGRNLKGQFSGQPMNFSQNPNLSKELT